MPDEFRLRPPERVIPFIGGLVVGLIGATLLTMIVGATIANVVNHSGGGDSSTPLVIGITALLGLAVSAIVAIIRVSKRTASSGKYFLMGVLTGVCVTWLLMGACFGLIASFN